MVCSCIYYNNVSFTSSCRTWSCFGVWNCSLWLVHFKLEFPTSSFKSHFSCVYHIARCFNFCWRHQWTKVCKRSKNPSITKPFDLQKNSFQQPFTWKLEELEVASSTDEITGTLRLSHLLSLHLLFQMLCNWIWQYQRRSVSSEPGIWWNSRR